MKVKDVKRLLEAEVHVQKDGEYIPHEYVVINNIADKIQSWLENHIGKKSDGEDMVLSLDDPEIRKILDENPDARIPIDKFTYSGAFDRLRKVMDKDQFNSVLDLLENYLDPEMAKKNKEFDLDEVLSDPDSVLNKPYALLSVKEANRKKELRTILGVLHASSDENIKKYLFNISDIDQISMGTPPSKEEEEAEVMKFLGTKDPASPGQVTPDMGDLEYSKSQATSKKIGRMQAKTQAQISCDKSMTTEEMMSNFSSNFFTVPVPRELVSILELSGGEIGSGEFLLKLLLDPKMQVKFQPKLEKHELEDIDYSTREASQAFYDIKIGNEYWHIKDMRASDRSVADGIRIGEKTKDKIALKQNPVLDSLYRLWTGRYESITRANLIEEENVMHILQEVLLLDEFSSLRKAKPSGKSASDYKASFAKVARYVQQSLDELTRNALRQSGKHNVAGVIAIIGGQADTARISSYVFIPIEAVCFQRLSSKGIHLSIIDQKIGPCMEEKMKEILDKVEQIKKHVDATAKMNRPEFMLAPEKADSENDEVDLKKLSQSVYSTSMNWWYLAVTNNLPLSPVVKVKDLPEIQYQDLETGKVVKGKKLKVPYKQHAMKALSVGVVVGKGSYGQALKAMEYAGQAKEKTLKDIDRLSDRDKDADTTKIDAPSWFKDLSDQAWIEVFVKTAQDTGQFRDWVHFRNKTIEDVQKVIEENQPAFDDDEYWKSYRRNTNAEVARREWVKSFLKKEGEEILIDKYGQDKYEQLIGKKFDPNEVEPAPAWFKDRSIETWKKEAEKSGEKNYVLYRSKQLKAAQKLWDNFRDPDFWISFWSDVDDEYDFRIKRFEFVENWVQPNIFDTDLRKEKGFKYSEEKKYIDILKNVKSGKEKYSEEDLKFMDPEYKIDPPRWHVKSGSGKNISPQELKKDWIRYSKFSDLETWENLYKIDDEKELEQFRREFYNDRLSMEGQRTIDDLYGYDYDNDYEFKSKEAIEDIQATKSLLDKKGEKLKNEIEAMFPDWLKRDFDFTGREDPNQIKNNYIDPLVHTWNSFDDFPFWKSRAKKSLEKSSLKDVSVQDAEKERVKFVKQHVNDEGRKELKNKYGFSIENSKTSFKDIKDIEYEEEETIPELLKRVEKELDLPEFDEFFNITLGDARKMVVIAEGGKETLHLWGNTVSKKNQLKNLLNSAFSKINNIFGKIVYKGKEKQFIQNVQYWVDLENEIMNGSDDENTQPLSKKYHPIKERHKLEQWTRFKARQIFMLDGIIKPSYIQGFFDKGFELGFFDNDILPRQWNAGMDEDIKMESANFARIVEESLLEVTSASAYSGGSESFVKTFIDPLRDVYAAFEQGGREAFTRFKTITIVALKSIGSIFTPFVTYDFHSTFEAEASNINRIRQSYAQNMKNNWDAINNTWVFTAYAANPAAFTGFLIANLRQNEKAQLFSNVKAILQSKGSKGSKIDHILKQLNNIQKEQDKINKAQESRLILNKDQLLKEEVFRMEPLGSDVEDLIAETEIGKFFNRNAASLRSEIDQFVEDALKTAEFILNNPQRVDSVSEFVDLIKDRNPDIVDKRKYQNSISKIEEFEEFLNSDEVKSVLEKAKETQNITDNEREDVINGLTGMEENVYWKALEEALTDIKNYYLDFIEKQVRLIQVAMEEQVEDADAGNTYLIKKLLELRSRIERITININNSQ